MCNGMQAAGEVADVVLLRDCPIQVVEAFSVSRATLGKIRENLVWAFGYNLVGIPVAAGALPPTSFLALRCVHPDPHFLLISCRSNEFKLICLLRGNVLK
jgi:cation transport ATPase